MAHKDACAFKQNQTKQSKKTGDSGKLLWDNIELALFRVKPCREEKQNWVSEEGANGDSTHNYLHVKCCVLLHWRLWGTESKKTFARPSLPLRTPELALVGAGTRHCPTQRCCSGSVEHLKESWSVGRRCSCCRERERERITPDECGSGGQHL